MFTDPGEIDSEYIKLFQLKKDYSVKCDICSSPNVENSVENSYLTNKNQTSHNSNSNSNCNCNNSPNITDESFKQLFDSELSLDASEFENINYQTGSRNLKSKKLFYKFLYYTRELEINQIIQKKHYCPYCKIIRPERSHHCRECKKCILKMDHHYEILNSCVGYYNYRPWLVFVFFSTIILLFIMLTMIDGISFYLDKMNYGIETINCKVFLFTFVLIIIAFISVGELLITHLLFILKGVTTIEDKSRNMMDQIVGKDNPDKPDVGFMYQMMEIFGRNCCKWFMPISK